MLGKLPDINQRELFRPMLTELIDPHHELVLLANSIARTSSRQTL